MINAISWYPTELESKKTGTITKIRMNPTYLQMWLHQNNAQISDCLEGVLLDNLLVLTKRGWAAIYENAINANASDYIIEFQTGTAPDVFKHWDAFEQE